MKIFILLLVLTAGGISGCRQAAHVGDSEKPATAEKTDGAKPAEVVSNYEKDGVKFPLPKNWQVSADETISESVRYITAEDDAYTVFSVFILPKDGQVDLMKYADEFVTGMKEKIPSGRIGAAKTANTQRSFNGYDHPGIEKKFSVTTAGETVAYTAQTFLVKGDEKKAIVIVSAPDEDFPKAEPLLKIIFADLRF